MKNSCAIAASNMRKELKALFPNTKFEIHSKSYTGGSSINVSYENGPSYEEVEKICNEYQCGWFDGMEDMYHYHKGFDYSKGSAKYVFVNRKYSEEVLNKAIVEKWGYDLSDKDTYDKRNMINSVIYDLREKSFVVVKSHEESDKKINVRPSASSVEILFNEERNGVELKFDGKPSQDVIEEMKGFGFRWNPKTYVWYAKKSDKTLQEAERLKARY